MGFSFRIRLPGGRLKIKTQDRLRRRELLGEVPVKRVADLYFVWEPRKKARDETPTG